MHQEPVWTWETPLFVISIGLRRKMYENVGRFNREGRPFRRSSNSTPPGMPGRSSARQMGGLNVGLRMVMAGSNPRLVDAAVPECAPYQTELLQLSTP